MTGPGPDVPVRDDEVFLRMTLAERLQHGLLILSFGILVLTGFPLFFPDAPVFRSLFAPGDAYSLRGALHRAAAVLLVLDLAWHFGHTTFTKRGRENFKEMTPGIKDLRDAVTLFGYSAGFSGFLHRKGIFREFFDRHPFWRFEKPPEYGRYSFIEKFEYWAVAWGSLIMIVSGFFMWNVGLSLKLFPLWVHDVFVIAHGYESMLALLAIIIWHMYNVHLNPEVFPMSRIWLDGKITGREIRTRHRLEYRKILAGRKSNREQGPDSPRTSPPDSP
jgi:cytochrome b subunit of formate dehydrogenase